jgi:hypothetical protein
LRRPDWSATAPSTGPPIATRKPAMPIATPQDEVAFAPSPMIALAK